MTIAHLRLPRKQFRLRLGLLLAAVTTLAAVACGVDGTAQQPDASPQATAAVNPVKTPRSGEIDRYFDIQVSLSETPKLNEPFTVTAKFTPIIEDEIDAEVWIEVNTGAYLEGEDRWHGQLLLGQEKVLTASYVLLVEGMSSINGVSFSNKPGQTFLRGLDIDGDHLTFLVTSKGCEWGGGGSMTVSRKLGDIAAGHAVVVDTASLLNVASSELIELLDSPEDVTRLQKEGLFPKELRYQWRNLNGIDWNTSFLVVFIGPNKPSSGHLAVFEHDLKLVNGIPTGRFTQRDAPSMIIPQTSRPVSATVVQHLSWIDKPAMMEIPAFQEGENTLAIGVDDRNSTLSLASLYRATPTPTATRGPGEFLPYNFLEPRLVRDGADSFKSGEEFDVLVRAVLVGGPRTARRSYPMRCLARQLMPCHSEVPASGRRTFVVAVPSP